MACQVIAFCIVFFTIASGSIIPTVKVLQGPGSRTSLYGPDGSALESTAPGGTLVTGSSGATGLVAAGPAILPQSSQVVVGGGPAGKIVSSYTLAGPAVVPAVAPGAAVVAVPTAIATPSVALGVSLGSLGTVSRLYDDGQYRPGHY